jgi:hypothetical protein
VLRAAAGCERTAGLDATAAAATGLNCDCTGACAGRTGAGVSQLLEAALLHVGDSSSICNSCSSSQQESATCGMRRDLLKAAGSDCFDSAACADLPGPAMAYRSPSSVGLRTWLTALSRLLQELLCEGCACTALLLPQLLALLAAPTLCCVLSGCSTGLSLTLTAGLTCCLGSCSGFGGSTGSRACLNTLLLRSDCSESLTENVLVSTEACCCWDGTGLHVQVNRLHQRPLDASMAGAVVLCRPHTPVLLCLHTNDSSSRPSRPPGLRRPELSRQVLILLPLLYVLLLAFEPLWQQSCPRGVVFLQGHCRLLLGHFAACFKILRVLCAVSRQALVWWQN